MVRKKNKLAVLLDFSFPVLIPKNKIKLENSNWSDQIAMDQSIISGMQLESIPGCVLSYEDAYIIRGC